MKHYLHIWSSKILIHFPKLKVKIIFFASMIFQKIYLNKNKKNNNSI